MKRYFLFPILLCLSVAFFAQEPKWTISVLPGYQLNAPTDRDNDLWSENFVATESKKALVASADVGYKITDHFALHFSYVCNKSKYDKYFHEVYRNLVWGPRRYTNNVKILEIGPEWQFKIWEKGELYMQVNIGWTFSNVRDNWSRYAEYYGSKNRPDTWTVGTTLGLRYFFTDNFGLATQVSCHYFHNWWYSPIWDARAGLVFRF